MTNKMIYDIIIHVEIQLVRNCVRVARQTLTLFVRVRILLPQPVESLETQYAFGAFLYLHFVARDGAVFFIRARQMKTPLKSEP